MKISIITPSYNQGQFIEETIESVLNQKDADVEMIVMDGGSTDGTLDILKRYSERVKWFSGKDKGQTDAINKGMKIASGDILAYLNSDDCYTEGALSKVSRYFKNHPDCSILTGDYIIVNEKGERIQDAIARYKRMLRKHHSFSLLSITNYIIQPSTFWRRELLDEIGFFNEDLDYVMDYEYWLRIMQKYKLHVVPDTLSVFRIHSSSKGGHLFIEQFEEQFQTAKKFNRKRAVIFLHWLHNKLITSIYKIIK